MRTAQDLLTELNASDESHRIEAKRAPEIGKAIIETVIAFANEPGPGGGYQMHSQPRSPNPLNPTSTQPSRAG